MNSKQLVDTDKDCNVLDKAMFPRGIESSLFASLRAKAPITTII
jgi:hypothetical protein